MRNAESPILRQKVEGFGSRSTTASNNTGDYEKIIRGIERDSWNVLVATTKTSDILSKRQNRHKWCDSGTPGPNKMETVSIASSYRESNVLSVLGERDTSNTSEITQDDGLAMNNLVEEGTDDVVGKLVSHFPVTSKYPMTVQECDVASPDPLEFSNLSEWLDYDEL